MSLRFDWLFVSVTRRLWMEIMTTKVENLREENLRKSIAHIFFPPTAMLTFLLSLIAIIALLSPSTSFNLHTCRQNGLRPSSRRVGDLITRATPITFNRRTSRLFVEEDGEGGRDGGTVISPEKQASLEEVRFLSTIDELLVSRGEARPSSQPRAHRRYLYAAKRGFERACSFLFKYVMFERVYIFRGTMEQRTRRRNSNPTSNIIESEKN